MTATLLRADAGRLPLADASVDLIVTSPPYWALRSYQDGGEHYGGQIGAEPTPAAYVDALIDCTREWARVLRPEGSIWVNLGDKYSTYESTKRSEYGGELGERQEAASQRATRYTRSAPAAYGVPYKSLFGMPWRYALRCIDGLGLTLRAEVIWSKPNGLPESITDRVRRAHETWFHFVRQPRYFAAVDAIREPAQPRNYRDWSTRKDLGEPGRQIEQRHTFGRGMEPHARGALPGSVREVATRPLKVPAELGIDHFAAFPMDWPRWIIQGWAPESGVVLDPFGGTGTTALVAHALGRHGISVDMSADYCRLARWRTTDPGQLAAAMQVEKPPVQIAGQDALFAIPEGAA